MKNRNRIVAAIAAIAAMAVAMVLGALSGNVTTGDDTGGSDEMSAEKQGVNVNAADALNMDGYTLKWEDDFNGDKLNRDDWNVELHEPGWVNAELQEYVDSEQNIQVKDGCLYLNPIQTKVGNAEGKPDGTAEYAYTSGRVNTQNKHDFKYGLFEAKVKVPKGMGYLPAFWMMPTDENLYGQWPRCGEIDCMEVLGQDVTTAHGTIHFGNPHSQDQGSYVLSDGDNYADNFHVFSCEWEPGKISWYIDGKKFHEASDWYSTTEGKGTVTYPAPFDQPFHIILNLAVGGEWVGYPDDETFDAQPFVIDYVKVYQKDSYDENVRKPTNETALRNPDADGNYIINGDFAVSEDLVEAEDWQFMIQQGGKADAEIADNTMTITTTNAGSVDYSVQLVQANVPFQKGAWYKVSFEAKADAERQTNVAVKAPDRGWQEYMSEIIDLTTEYKTYEIPFKMTADSDANGRLEYNMGAFGSTAAIYIKNVRIEKTKEPDPNEKEAKAVLSDGNYVYNGEFQEGENRLAYWTISDGIEAGVTSLEEGRQLKAVVKADGASIFQDELAVGAKGKYQLSFDAQADGDKTIKITVAGVEKTLKLSSKNKNYVEQIVLPETIDNKNFSITFTDQGTYLIDNVRLVEDTLIKNGSFDADLAGFEVYLYNSADAVYTVDSQREDNAFDVTISNTNDAEWKIQLKQGNVKLEKGKKYKLSFDIKSSLARSFSYAIQRNGITHNEDWTPYVQEPIKLKADDSAYTKIEKEFTMEYDTDEDSIFNIALGGGNITEKHRVCIDNIVLEVVGE